MVANEPVLSRNGVVAGGPHLLGREQNLERDVEPAASPGRRRRRDRAAAPDRRPAARRPARGKARAPRRSPPRATPWWRSSWPGTARAAAYSHAWMSRADQSLSRQKPKMCSPASAIGTGSPSAVGRADVEAELQLVVESAARPIDRRGLVRSLGLAERPAHRRAAHAHRRGAAVIGDRHVFVVRQSGLSGRNIFPALVA